MSGSSHEKAGKMGNRQAGFRCDLLQFQLPGKMVEHKVYTLAHRIFLSGFLDEPKLAQVGKGGQKMWQAKIHIFQRFQTEATIEIPE